MVKCCVFFEMLSFKYYLDELQIQTGNKSREERYMQVIQDRVLCPAWVSAVLNFRITLVPLEFWVWLFSSLCKIVSNWAEQSRLVSSTLRYNKIKTSVIVLVLKTVDSSAFPYRKGS
jgi:hypothetical protein